MVRLGMRLPVLLSVALTACVEVPVTVEDTAVSSSVVDLATLRSGAVSAGTLVVGPLRMTTGLASDRLTAFAQDPVDGAGIELRAGETLDGWPPPVGTPFKVRGYFAGDAAAPVIWVSATKDMVVTGEVEPVLVLDGETPPPPLALARWEAVEVWTEPDPAGRAELSVRRSTDGRFGRFVPGAGNTGALTGVLLGDGRIAPRSEDDWQGTRDPGVVLPSSVESILAGEVEAGATVTFEATQIAPWSIGGRYTVLQDAGGRGLWVDAEAWFPWVATEGTSATFTGQVQVVGGQWILRSWTPPVSLGLAAAPPVTSANVVHGALVDLTVAGIRAADVRGERVMDGDLVLDDRFRPIDTIGDGWSVRGVVDDTAGGRHLCVLAATPPPLDEL